MNKLTVFKTAARIIVGLGTTTISNSIIKNNVQPANMIQTISVGVTSVVIGSMASEATKSHTEAKIDEFVEFWNRNRSTENPEPANA